MTLFEGNSPQKRQRERKRQREGKRERKKERKKANPDYVHTRHC